MFSPIIHRQRLHALKKTAYDDVDTDADANSEHSSDAEKDVGNRPDVLVLDDS